jgi:hypothetical protein
MYPATIIGWQFNVVSAPWGAPITVTWPQPQVGDLIIIVLVTGGNTTSYNDYTVPPGWIRLSFYMMAKWATDTSTSVNIWRRDSTTTPTAAWISLVVRPSTTITDGYAYAVGDTYVDSSGGLVSYVPFSNAVRVQKPSDAICPLFGVQYVFSSTATGAVSDGGPTVIASLATGGTQNISIALGYENLAPNQNAYGGFILNPARQWVYYAAVWFYESERYTSGPISIAPSSRVQAAAQVTPWSAAVQIAPRAQVTARTPRILPFGVPVTYRATTDGTDAGSTATIQPGGGRRSLLRFPLWGEYPPRARITKVELRCSVTTPGAGGTWEVRAYPDRADPEQDDFATQYSRAAQGNLYTVTTAFRSGGVAALDLGPQASADLAAALDPRWGYFALAMIETSGAAAPTLDNVSLTVYYDVPPPPRRPLQELVSTTLFRPGVPPVPAAVDLTDYALRVRMRWQGPGDFTLTVPAGSPAAAALAEMGLVLVRVMGVPVFCGVQETWRLRRTPTTGLRGALIEVSGQSIHRFLGNRITGPFPAGLNHAEQAWQSPIGAEVEVFSAGDPSPRGEAFGAASASAESVLRKLLVTHTVAAHPARRTAWTNNLRFAPDDRRGVDTGTTVSTRLQPLLAEAEKLCHRADCGYEVLLADDGTFRWFFLPGANRTGEHGRWTLSADLTPGVQEVEVTRAVTQLVTHVYLAGAGTGAQRTLGVYRQQGSMEAQYDRREAAVDGANATSDAAAELYATAYLSQHLPRRTVTLSLPNLLDAGWLTAWYLGDQLTVVDPETGISEVQRVYEIELVIGTEGQVQAVLGDVADPAIIAILEPAGPAGPAGPVEGGITVAAGTVVTAPSPLPSAGTWKETGQATLR